MHLYRAPSSADDPRPGAGPSLPTISTTVIFRKLLSWGRYGNRNREPLSPPRRVSVRGTGSAPSCSCGGWPRLWHVQPVNRAGNACSRTWLRCSDRRLLGRPSISTPAVAPAAVLWQHPLSPPIRSQSMGKDPPDHRHRSEVAWPCRPHDRGRSGDERNPSTDPAAAASSGPVLSCPDPSRQ